MEIPAAVQKQAQDIATQARLPYYIVRQVGGWLVTPDPYDTGVQVLPELPRRRISRRVH